MTGSNRSTAPNDVLEMLLQEHSKYRDMCADLERLAAAEVFDAAVVAKLAEIIRSDFTMHVFDEEQGLFPLLRQRCLPEDDIELLFQRLRREHAERSDTLAQARIALLTSFTEARPLSQIPGAAETLRACADGLRRLMVLEDDVMIPLARKRLSSADLATLAARLAGRLPARSAKH